MKDIALKIIDDLKKYDSLYVIGHNNTDADSYFSSYILSVILKSFGLNTKFSILEDYKLLEEDKDLMNDYLKEKPNIIKYSELKDKNIILVDHNDPSQSVKDNPCNIVLSIDHHIETNRVKNSYSIEYTSTALYIYDLFKEVYDFSKELKELIALTVMTDSCYLTTSRFKDSDKLLYNELNVDLDVTKVRDKYFKTIDFNSEVDYNINNNHKVYHVDNMEINRIIFKSYSRDRKYLEEYINRANELYSNNLFIWNEFDTLITEVYYKGEFLKKYDHIVTSSMLITKDLIKEIREKYN
ncbi:MAG: DHH family phosphoesterase [Bacilli bacterium]|nr:DHH family phosphoesterase [Bacilli bacterium]